MSCSSEKSDSATSSDSPARRLAQPTEDGFALVDDFYSSLTGFQSDTFDVDGYSTDGGQLITFRSDDREYMVWDIWLFGETGRSHSVYWTDKNLNVLIAECTRFDYDKPYYETGYNTGEVTTFFSYRNGGVAAFDSNRRKIDAADVLENGKSVMKLFLDVLTHPGLRSSNLRTSK